jgi:acyl-CoA synthetase (AMP-forming)/AMP-acid ligase II
MTIWNWDDSDWPAVVSSEGTFTYGQLNNDIENFQRHLVSDKKELVLLLCENKYDLIVAYLAVLRNGHTAMLMSAETNEGLLKDIITNYKPAWVYGTYEFLGYEFVENSFWRRMEPNDVQLNKDLAVLLSTSGTTGSKKFVRLSYKNIQENAESISTYLNLNENERGVVNLPISYSYGLSIVHSHLQAGATILLTNESVIEKNFWTFLNQERATSFAGVPFTYQMLRRIGFLKMDLPYLRSYTQAGGRLDERLVKMFNDYAIQNGKRFFVMYGQTEASPRMSYIPPDQLSEKSGTIGIPIPGGTFRIDSQTSELIYEGPNVMLGYAKCLEDLTKGDECFGILHTGDTAIVDNDGFYSITGRLKRFVKLFGLRVNLDEIEKRLELETQSIIACLGNDDKLIVVVESNETNLEIVACLESVYKLHKSAYRIHVVDEIPRMANGKTDYATIRNGLE